MSTEVLYEIISAPDANGKVTVRRLSDGKIAKCKPSWLKVANVGGAPNAAMMASSHVKAIRLSGLDWTTES